MKDFSFHFPLRCHLFTHPCCSIFLPDPHIYVCNPWRAQCEAEAQFLSVLSVLLWHHPLSPNSWWWHGIFFLEESCIAFSLAQFLPVLRTFTLETEREQNRHGPCGRLCGGVFLNLAEAIWCFHCLRCLQLLSTELFILITSLVFFHHVHVWLDWYGCMCVCVYAL